VAVELEALLPGALYTFRVRRGNNEALVKECRFRELATCSSGQTDYVILDCPSTTPNAAALVVDDILEIFVPG
jgi:Mrp family chromosome partitioning ATPase